MNRSDIILTKSNFREKHKLSCEQTVSRHHEEEQENGFKEVG